MAVTNITPQELCLKIQHNLENVSGNIPTNIDSLGTLNALQSAENTAGFEKISTTRTDGKLFSASVKFKQGKCYTPVEEELDVCDAVSEATNPNKEYSVSVDEVVQVPITLNAETFRVMCDTLDERKNWELVQAVEALQRKVNNKLISKITADLDNYYNGNSSAIGGSDEISLKLFTSDGKPNTMGFYQLIQMYKKLGYLDRMPIVVGGDPLEAWKFARNQFAGNFDKQYDTSKIAGMSMFTDYKIDDYASDGSQHLISFIPGHLQLLESYKNVGAYEVMRQEGMRTTMTMNNFTFDIDISNPFCSDGVVTMLLSKRFDLFKVPSTAFSSCGARETVLGWQADCGALTCSDLKVLS